MGHSRGESCVDSPKAVDGPLRGCCKDVACGRDHTISCTNNGEVYTWGSGSSHQLGLGDTDTHEEPQLVVDLEHVRIQRVACGSYFSAALSEDGALYTWGTGEEGQLGSRHKRSKLPTQVEIPEQVINMSCGYYHAMAVTVRGEVYVFGEGEMGKTGVGSEKDVFHPTLIPGLSGVKSVSCGSRHSACVDGEGHLYTWGCNDHGQLGHGENLKNISEPKRVTKGIKQRRFVQVSCGSDHTAVLDESGNVFTFGENRNGKIGVPQSVTDIWEAHRVKYSPSIQFRKVKCGGVFTLLLTACDSGEGSLVFEDLSNPAVLEVNDASFIDDGTKKLGPLDKLPPLKPLAAPSALPAIENKAVVSEYEDTSRQKAKLAPSALFNENENEGDSSDSDYGAEFVEKPKVKSPPKPVARQDSETCSSMGSKTTVSSTVSEPPLPRRVSSLHSSTINSPAPGSPNSTPTMKRKDVKEASLLKEAAKKSASRASAPHSAQSESEQSESSESSRDLKEDSKSSNSDSEKSEKEPVKVPSPKISKAKGKKESPKQQRESVRDKRKMQQKKNKKSSTCSIL